MNRETFTKDKLKMVRDMAMEMIITKIDKAIKELLIKTLKKGMGLIIT